VPAWPTIALWLLHAASSATPTTFGSPAKHDEQCRNLCNIYASHSHFLSSSSSSISSICSLRLCLVSRDLSWQPSPRKTENSLSLSYFLHSTRSSACRYWGHWLAEISAVIAVANTAAVVFFAVSATVAVK